MRTFFLVLKTIIFILVFVFSLNNTHITTINIFPGTADIAMDAPLIIWLILFFFLGMIVAALFFFPSVLRSIRSKKRNVS